MSTLFNQPDNGEGVEVFGDNQEIQSYKELLVGEGKKYRSDEDLAKAYYHADKTIKRREKELEEQRKEINSRANLEALIDKLSASSNNSGVSNSDNTNRQNEQQMESAKTTELSHEKIMEIARNALNQEKQKTLREQNIDSCVTQLRSAWGVNYATVLESKALDLGVTKEQLTEMAASSPKVFLSAVLGADERRITSPESVLPPRQSVNATAKQQFGPSKDKAYFDKLRRESPSVYWSAKVQNEIFSLVEQGKLSL